MLRTLLTPLSAHFALSPRAEASTDTTHESDALTPEDFTRDVLVELMKKSVERLKVADGLSMKTEVLVEIHKIMLEDARTKDVFREMDGFLVVMNALSTLPAADPAKEAKFSDKMRTEIVEAARLVFMILSEAMFQHQENAEYFKCSVGYESLSEAMLGLISNTTISNDVIGFLVSLALHKFSMSGIFEFAPNTDYAELDRSIRDFEPAFGLIQQPDALLVLYNFLPLVSTNGPALRYCIYRLLERLSYHNHRNHCILNSIGLVEPLFHQYCKLKDDASVSKQERQIVQKLLRRLADAGTTTDHARLMFQRVVRADDTLDTDVLEVLRAGMKVKWPEHFSLESPAALRIWKEGARALPSTGFTFMIWLWIERFPLDKTHPIFSYRVGDHVIFALSIRSDGSMECTSSGSRAAAVFKTTVTKSRWTHITLVHHPHRASNPTIRLFLDGVLSDSLNWPYPRIDATFARGTYVIGDNSEMATMSWCMASSYLISVPLADSLPRVIHHLGPRYVAKFQATDLVRFLTYEASTALHIFLAGGVSPQSGSEIAHIRNTIKSGLGVNEAAVLFALNPASELQNSESNELEGATCAGDVFAVQSSRLDSAMWKIGGAAVALRLVQLANSQHEVSRALGILTDGLRNSWQNSEDMERLRGYEVLAELLRSKSQYINMTGFETIFEFLGMNFRSPDQSTIVNAVAYRAIALDFQLWSCTRKEIQQLHLGHFATLLEVSKHRRFNAKQRIARFGVVRKLLFVLQTALYPYDMVPFLVEALKVVAQAHFTPDDAIKPIVSYLAANLHEVGTGVSSPRSVISRIDYQNAQIKAEKVLEMTITILQLPAAYAKFSSTLPVTRICLLLLGERPSPSTAVQILRLIGISLQVSTSFSRKFELVSGWSVLKAVLPYAWDERVQMISFGVLFGRGDGTRNSETVVCPQIVPAIFSSLKTNLETIGDRVVRGGFEDSVGKESAVEHLLEELIAIHSANLTFRQIFKSQTITQGFIDAYKSFVTAVSLVDGITQSTIRILEKLSHLGLSIALDNSVAGSQKQEILEILQSAETALNPRSSQETAIDTAAVVGGKIRRRRVMSVRLSVQLGEGTVKRSISRVHEWRKTIVVTERKRLRKTVLDLREHHRQICTLIEWATVLTTERGLWAKAGHERRWQLDETEGPYRVRKKLEPVNEKTTSSKVETMSHFDELKMPETDTQSVMRLEVPPWAESYEVSSTEVDGHQLDEDIVEDKHRRVRHELEPGDVIEAANTVARIFGVDSSPGLLILGRTHLYMLDGLVQNDDGEVIDAHDAPRKLFFVPGSIIELDGPQRAQRWNHDQIVAFSDRTFLFRDVALELYFRDSRSLLIVFLDKQQRQEIIDRLSSVLARLAAEPLTPGLLKSPLRSPLMGRLSARVGATLGANLLTGLRLDELSTAQRKWQAREISNFTYLSILNQVSGRTPSDATQYPVFPWVLSDYASETLDLRCSDSFRDLTRPMGALTAARRDAASARYSSLESVGEKPFHYGTHFSSSMIVCHFLIRLEPFSHMFKTLQGGDWDLPDRLFSDIKRAYESASQDVRGDVRELIPEFFSCPEFLQNLANLDFGVQQNTGQKIHDITLPPWAKQDPLLFITLNREALESNYVSENLPHWIDLIWGCKQRDPGSLNVFHPLSYEGSIDLDSITDDLEREATVGIIHNFGQTPRKIFHTPHPPRFMHGNPALPLGTLYGIAEDYHLLSQADKATQDLGQDRPVRELVFDLAGQRVVPCGAGTIYVPSHPHEEVEWDSGLAFGGELKVLVNRKVVQVVEATFCSCAAFADPETLVTGSLDHTVCLWHVNRGSNSGIGAPWQRESALSITLTHIMRAHTSEVICVTASRTWSLAVTGSKDGSAALWDLNRGAYVKSIWHGPGDNSEVHLVTVNESIGYIATCSRSKLCLHTVNAQRIVCLDLAFSTAPHSYPPITSMAFLEREYSRVGVLATGGPDGTITLRTWNTDKTPEGQKAEWSFVTLRTMKVKGPDGEVQRRGCASCVTALKFIGECLYHGEDTGKVYSWDLPD